MRKRLSDRKAAAAADPIELAAKVVQTVVDTVKKVVTDVGPRKALPPADLVPETPPSSGALGESAEELTAKDLAAVAGRNRRTKERPLAAAKKPTPKQRADIAKKAAPRRGNKGSD